MNETRETANADRYQAIPRLAGISPPAGRKMPFFFIKNSHLVRIFYEKEKNVPCCRRRIGLPPGQTPGLHAHRVTPDL
jgi:hypothetical protein